MGKSGERVSELSLQRYEAVEDAFLAGNRYYRAADPIGRARAQWMAWESVGGKGATHSVWLNIVQGPQLAVASEAPVAPDATTMTSADVASLPVGSIVYPASSVGSNPLIVVPLPVGTLAPISVLPERAEGRAPDGEPTAQWGNEFVLVSKGHGKLPTHGTAKRTAENWRPGRAEETPTHAPETDRRGQDLHPGDRVRFKLYPRGTAEGVIVVSPRARVVMPDRSTRPALAIQTDDGTIYNLSSGGTTKLGARATENVGSDLVQATDVRYPKAGPTVDGYRVRDHVPNLSSIEGYFGESETLPGVRAVPMSDFGGPNTVFYAADDFDRSKRLADTISESKELNPLIIGVDAEGPFIIEGAHRFVALFYLGAKSFPAVVVVGFDSASGSMARAARALRSPAARESVPQEPISSAQFTSIYLAVAETGDPSYGSEFEADPRLPVIVNALSLIGVTQLLRILGYGSFGVAAMSVDGRVVKLTSDPAEVQVGAVLVGKSLPNVVDIYGAWNIRNVNVNTEIGWDDEKEESIRKSMRVGVLIEQFVSTREVQDYDFGSPGQHLTEVVYDFKEATNNAFANYAKLGAKARRAKLERASIELEGVLRKTGRPLEHDVAEALAQLRTVGVYAIDVHGRNVGWDAFDERFRIFDIGVGSPPPDAAKPRAVGGQRRRGMIEAAESVAPAMEVPEIGASAVARESAVQFVDQGISPLSEAGAPPNIAPENLYISRTVQRYALVDPSASPPPSNTTYFVDTTRKTRTGANGRALKTPRVTTVPGAAPGTVAFIDFHPYGANGLYIDYMRVRPDLQGHGLGNQLVSSFYQAASTRGIVLIDWGKVMHEHAWKIMLRMRAEYPKIDTIGKHYF